MPVRPPRRPHVIRPVAVALVVAGLAGCRATPPRSDASAARAAARDPVRALAAEGDAARRDGRVDEAVELYERALAIAPGSVPVHLRLVATWVGAGRRRAALERYTAKAAAPGAIEVERVMAARLSTDGSPAAVRRVYVDAALRSPGDPWWRLALAEIDLAAAERALSMRDEARAAGDRARADAWDDRVRRALTRAQSAVEHAAERDASIPEISLYRGLVRSMEGDLLPSTTARTSAYRAAMEAFRRATQEAPDMVEAWADLADASGRAGEKASAISAWQAAVRLAPHDASLREGLGLSLHEAERHEDAAAQYAEAAKLRPRDGTPLLMVGDSWAELSKFERALASYDAALERDPSLVEAYAKRGAALEQLGRLAQARESYAVYVERDGKNSADVKRRIERILAPAAQGSR